MLRTSTHAAGIDASERLDRLARAAWWGSPRDARPEPLEPEIERGLAALEGRRSLYGKWRGQQEQARQLVQLRRSVRAPTR